MENVVEDVEHQSESEGSPGYSQRYEDLRRCEVVGSSDSVHHNDVLSNLGHQKSHHGQTD